MSDNTKNKKVEIEDGFSKDHIDQLHKAVLGFSSQSFEIKKMCVTVEIGAFTLIVSAFKDNYSDPKFIALLKIIGLAIPILFYIVDVCTYFYQDKLRGLMYIEENEIKVRHNIQINKNERFEETKFIGFKRLLRSIFAVSNIIYWGLILLSIIFPLII